MKTLIMVIVQSVKDDDTKVRFLRSDKDEMHLHGVRMHEVPFANPLYGEMQRRFYQSPAKLREDLEWDRGQLSEQWNQIVYCYIREW